MENETCHQQLMNKSYEYWEENNHILTYEQFLKQLEKELGVIYKQAVITGNLNYQVENGGFQQWKDNDYYITLDDLINFFKSFTNDNIINNIIYILEDVKEEIDWHDEGMKLLENIENSISYFDIWCNSLDDELCKNLEVRDKNYYKINNRLIKILNDYFEKEINKIEAKENGDCYFDYFN